MVHCCALRWVGCYKVPWKIQCNTSLLKDASLKSGVLNIPLQCWKVQWNKVPIKLKTWVHQCKKNWWKCHQDQEVHMGKQSDWLLVHHLHCKMSAMCFRFYCATNLLFKRYLSILCSLFKDMLIAKPHLIPRRTRRVEQCTVWTGFKFTSKAASAYLVSSCTSVQSTLA